MPWGARAWVLDEYEDRLDRAIEWLLIGLLTFMPFAFGVVEAWSEEVVIALAGAISLCFCLKIALTRDRSVIWTWAYIPILVFVLIAALQAIHLPVGLVRLISPQTVAQKLELFGDLNNSKVPPSTMAISFYMHATKHDLRLVLAVAAVFVVVLNTIRRSDQIMRILCAIAIIGGVVALETLAQAVFANGKIYWFVTTPHRAALSGPFVNHSHYAQFMNLSIGAAIALILVRLHRRFAGRSITPAKVMGYLGSRDGKILIGVLLMVALGAASVFVSLSRGGMVSMMIAGSFTTLIVSSRKSLKGSGWIMALLALAAFACVVYIGFDAVYDRLETLRELDRAQAGRWQILKDIAVAWTRFPVLGTGLGTHEVVYPMFDRATIPAIASHAENEYAQAAETGIVGILALVVFGIMVWRSYARTIRSSRVAVHSAAYGLGFGLLAIMIHSLSDFGQHLPANAFLSAIFCALLIRLARMGPNTPDVAMSTDETVVTEGRTRRYGWLGLATVGIVCAVALLDADAARRGELHSKKAVRAERDMEEIDWQGSDGEYVYLLGHAAKAEKCQPDNILYRHWLNVYRWRAISRIDDPNTDITSAPEVLEFAQRIADELEEALLACPTYGPSWTVLGQMERFIDPESEEGARHIFRGRQLAPYDPVTCLVTGMLSADRGDAEAAFEHWKRAVELDRQLFDEVAALFISVLNRPDLACELASGDTARLIRVEQILARSKGDAALLSDLSERILGLLEQECNEPDAPAWKFAVLAQRHRRDGRIDAAVHMYRKALALEYSQVSWRYSLAQLLTDQGLVSEAARELQVCLRLRPEFRQAQRLLQELLVQRDPGKTIQ